MAPWSCRSPSLRLLRSRLAGCGALPGGDSGQVSDGSDETGTMVPSGLEINESLGGVRAPWCMLGAAARHSHVAVAWQGCLVLCGGELADGFLASDVWMFSMRVNSSDLFHVDLRHWSPLRGRDPQHGPRERAFHSASLLGSYMVVYGGQGALWCGVGGGVSGWWGRRGRVCGWGGGGGPWLHVGGAVGGQPLPHCPAPPLQYHLDYCSMYSESSTCGQDPECSWCLDACQSPAPHSNVSIVRSTTITLSPSSEMDVSLVYKGFIYPLLAGPPPAPHVSVWARVQRLHVVAKLGRTPNAPELEEVGRWAVQQEKETRPLQRPGAQRLFGSPERGNKYLVQVEGHLNSSGTGQSSELTLVWDRTGVPGGSEISYFFLEPFRAGSCPSYPSCLACLADQGCGWCPLSASCHGRLEGPGGGGPCGGGSVRLVLSPSNCFLCEEYRDCHACSADPFCEWQVNSSKKGDLLCSRRGRQPHAIRAPHDCPALCHQ
ncbi:NADH dehydrogenase [Platysternon megacephalum]|uniref:NADH dehydrogenase n=1 Tax=Platysternon megacephalum TaxID=55544 RepID=A0A4D9DEV1_9SAUR|nr:NADH dehydrogenase [Platysternon megacephalum]